MKGLTQRVITSIIFVAIIMTGIFGGITSFIGLCLLVTVLCSYELLGILLPDSGNHKQAFGVLVALVPSVYTLGWLGIEVPLIGILGIVGSVVLLAELFSHSKKPFTNAGSLIITTLYIGVPFALLISLAQAASVYEPILLFSIFLFTWANDTGAYFVGSFIGKHKLFERISPKKTIEGFIGGVGVAMLAGYVIFLVFGILELSQWLKLAFIVGITATLGDLVESMLKRSMNIKDSGTILPGHGGFLDRFDGFIFAIPFVYLYLTLIH